MARKLRIAVSLFFGLLTVALCVLWVRSYWWWDVFVFNRAQSQSAINCMTAFGSVGIGIGPLQLPADTGFHAYLIKAEYRKEFYETTTLGFSSLSSTPGLGMITIPIWLPVALAMIGAWTSIFGRPKIRWRFSLRTLLIATTLVAVVLGLMV